MKVNELLHRLIKMPVDADVCVKFEIPDAMDECVEVMDVHVEEFTKPVVCLCLKKSSAANE